MSCLICNHSLDESATCKVGIKGRKNLIQCSLDRNDNLTDIFRNIDTLTLHTACRKKYTHRTYDGKLAIANIRPPNCGREINFEYIPTIGESTSLNVTRPSENFAVAETPSEIRPPNCGREINFEYIPTTAENTSLNVKRPSEDLTMETPSEKKVIITVTTSAENDNCFVMSTNLLNELDHTSEATGYLSELIYENNSNTELKYLPCREDNSLELTNIHASADNDNTVDTKKKCNYVEDPMKPFPFQHRCFLCERKFVCMKLNPFSPISKESTRERILSCLNKIQTPKNIKILQRIAGVDLLQAKVRCHWNCLSALRLQKATSRKSGRPLCPLLKAAMEKIYSYIENSDRTEFSSAELLSPSLLGDEYQPTWKSVETKLTAKYDGEIYFTKHGRDTLVTLLKDSGTLMQPWNWNDTDSEGQMEYVKKKKRKHDKTIEMNDNRCDVELIPENNEDFIDVRFQPARNVADATEEGGDNFIHERLNLEEKDEDVLENTTKDNVEDSLENNSKLTDEDGLENNSKENDEDLLENNTEENREDGLQSNSEDNEDILENISEKNDAEDTTVAAKNNKKYRHLQKPYEEDPTKPFPFQYRCFICAKTFGSMKANTYTVSKESTQQRILTCLKKLPTPKNIKILRRIEGVDLLQEKVRYHCRCLSSVRFPRKINAKRGRPECPLVTQAAEKVYRYMEESNRTEFTPVELLSKSIHGDYCPDWRMIELRLMKHYPGKIFTTPVPGHSTIVTLVKDGGSLGGTVVQPWNLNGTDLGWQAEDVRDQDRKRKCVKTKIKMVDANKKTNDNKCNKGIKCYSNDDSIDGTFSSDENAADVEIESNVLLICNICWSSDRKLEDLGDYRDVFTRLCSDVSIQDCKQKQFLLCWECIAVLKKFQHFQKRIMTAQKLWNSDEIREPPKCLSTLSISNTSSITSTATVSCTKKQNTVHEEKPSENRIQSEVDVDMPKDLDTPIVQGENDVYDDTFNNHDTNDVNVDDDSEDQERSRPMLRRRKAKEKRKTHYDSDQESEGSTRENNSLNRRKPSKDDSDWEWDEKVKNSQKERNRKDTETLNEEKRRQATLKIAYNVIVLKYITENKMQRVPIEPHELQYWLDAERNSDYFKSLKDKCMNCISMVPDNHKELCHSEENPFVCGICESTFPRNDEKESHVANHYYIFSCEFCRYKCYNEAHMRCHVESHRKLIQCLECFAAFQTFEALKEHCNNLHRYAECDHCGKRFAHKRLVQNHIERYHTTHVCTICNKKYSSYSRKMDHMNLKHRIERTEAAYCVQCDIQFDNVKQLKRHVYHNIRHKHEWKREPTKKIKEQHKCSECDKVYACKRTLRAHYNLVHAKKITFYCNFCDQAFPLRCHYQRHMLIKHEGYKAPKNKICNLCGRGFSTNRILTHHIRTHTGERPFACPHCAATFAQKSAFKTHIKRVHQLNPSAAGAKCA